MQRLTSRLLLLVMLLTPLFSVFAANPQKSSQSLKQNPYFVAVGNHGVICRSATGTADSWIDISSNNKGLSFTGVAYGKQRFIATAINGTAWLSLDAKNAWKVTDLTMYNSPNLSSKQLTCVTYGKGRFVAAGFTSGKGANYVMFFQLKDNATSWTSQMLPGPFTVKSIVCGKQNFVAVGEDRSSACAQIFILPVKEDELKTSRLKGVLPLNAVTYGQGNFLAVGLKGQVYRWSENMKRQTQYTLDGVSNLLGVTYADNRFVAVGFKGKVFYSKNGASKASWRTVTIPRVFCLYGITYGAGRYVAVGMDASYKGRTWWSTDLVNWHKSVQEWSLLNAVVYKAE